MEAVNNNVDGETIPFAAATTAGTSDDNQAAGHPSDPQDGSGLKPITQDKEVDNPVLEKITHQMQQGAEDSAEDV